MYNGIREADNVQNRMKMLNENANGTKEKGENYLVLNLGFRNEKLIYL